MLTKILHLPVVADALPVDVLLLAVSASERSRDEKMHFEQGSSLCHGLGLHDLGTRSCALSLAVA